jgi:hypothetical protein
MALKSIPIKDICLNGGTQQRAVDDDVMKRYAALMQDGHKFRPVEIITDGANNFLWDGFHRCFANLRNGNKLIEANVVEGTRRDAIYASFSANRENAFPRQPGTVKGIVEKILKDEEWSKISQHDISRYVGCTQAFVSKVCAEMTEVPEEPQADDKPQDSAKKNTSRSETVDVKRGDSEYKAKKPKKKVQDATGSPVPKHLVKIFKRHKEFRAPIKQLNDMLRAVRQGIEAEDKLYRFIKIENLTAEINNVKRIFRFALPYAVCPYCGGDENNDDCRACDGCGFVNEATYQATPKELK